jgi:hypothetical protein
MNKHIELVKKWLADKESVSREELEDNAEAAYAAANAYRPSAANDAYYRAYRAACCAAYAACRAAGDYAAYTDATAAAHWVRRYEESTK